MSLFAGTQWRHINREQMVGTGKERMGQIERVAWKHIKILDVQPGFRKGRGTRDQIVSIFWIIEKVKELKKYIFLLH